MKKIILPEGFEIDRIENNEIILKEIKNNSWEKFCNNISITNPEYYIDSDSTIKLVNECKRESDKDRNLFATKELAEAVLSFIQLLRLRDYFRKGYIPNWNDLTDKWVIYPQTLKYGKNIKNACIFTFQDEHTVDLFLKINKDLFIKIRPLYNLINSH